MAKEKLRGEEGISALEYLLIAALVAIIIIAGALALGTVMNTEFSEISETVDNPLPS